MADEEITVFGDGTQTRSFCYRDDLIEGMIRLMNCSDLHEPVNIGNPGEYTIRQLAETIIEMVGSRSKLSFHPLPKDDPTRRQPDIRLALAKLDWEPQIPLAEGLAKTIEWFRTIDIEQYRPPTPNF